MYAASKIASAYCLTPHPLSCSPLFSDQTLPLPVYLTLVPVVVGVGITSCNQIRFRCVDVALALRTNTAQHCSEELIT